MIAHDGLSQLVRRAQSSDPAAVAELLARLRPDLARFAEHFGDVSTGDESASDLAQEAALRLWEKLGQFEGGNNDERTAAMLHDWLEKLVRRLATNRREARHAAKRRPERPVFSFGAPAGTDSRPKHLGLEPAEGGPTPSAIACAAEVDARVRAALAAVPDPTDRQIIELCFFEAMSLRAVAGRLDLTYDKVRERYHAGLRFLERELEPLL
ncbi:MAG TPA: sigma-70 family RNA polymerase sigma factor [Pirellulales bacterium]|nr:sigma-70 family RNA polymerase sigma factor [Pirellulales bacterium]